MECGRWRGSRLSRSRRLRCCCLDRRRDAGRGHASVAGERPSRRRARGDQDERDDEQAGDPHRRIIAREAEHRQRRAECGDHGDDGGAGHHGTIEPVRRVRRDDRPERPVTPDEHPQRHLQRGEQHEGERHQPPSEGEGDEHAHRGQRRQQPPDVQRLGLGGQRAVLPPADPRRRGGDGEQRPRQPSAEQDGQQHQPQPNGGTHGERQPRRLRQPVRLHGDLDGHAVDLQRDRRRLDLHPWSADRRRVGVHPVGAVVVPRVAATGADLPPVRWQRRHRRRPAPRRRRSDRR